jgi:hypothetical protein
MVKTKEKTISEQGGYMLVIKVWERKMRGRERGEEESRSNQRKSRIIENGEVRNWKMHSRRYRKGERREGGRDHLHGLRV